MLCKIVPMNGDNPIEIEIMDTNSSETVSALIDFYKEINKNVHTVDGFIAYARSRGYTIVKKYPILFDL